MFTNQSGEIDKRLEVWIIFRQDSNWKICFSCRCLDNLLFIIRWHRSKKTVSNNERERKKNHSPFRFDPSRWANYHNHIVWNTWTIRCTFGLCMSGVLFHSRRSMNEQRKSILISIRSSNCYIVVVVVIIGAITIIVDELVVECWSMIRSKTIDCAITGKILLADQISGFDGFAPDQKEWHILKMSICLSHAPFSYVPVRFDKRENDKKKQFFNCLVCPSFGQ